MYFESTKRRYTVNVDSEQLSYQLTLISRQIIDNERVFKKLTFYSNYPKGERCNVTFRLSIIPFLRITRRVDLYLWVFFRRVMIRPFICCEHYYISYIPAQPCLGNLMLRSSAWLQPPVLLHQNCLTSSSRSGWVVVPMPLSIKPTERWVSGLCTQLRFQC